MALFDIIREALLAESLTPEHEHVLKCADDYLMYIRKHDVPERAVLERMAPGMVDETLEHQLDNLRYAMRSPGSPQARCASGFFGSFGKMYE